MKRTFIGMTSLALMAGICAWPATAETRTATPDTSVLPAAASPDTLATTTTPKENPQPEPDRTHAGAWLAVDGARMDLSAAVDRKKFDIIPPRALTIRENVQWLVDNSGGNADDLRSMQGVQEMINVHVETLMTEAPKKNIMLVSFSYRKLSQMIDSLHAIYRTPTNRKTAKGDSTPDKPTMPVKASPADTHPAKPAAAKKK